MMAEKKELELSLNAFNFLLSSRGVDLTFIGHSQAEEFENFAKDVVLKLNFRCVVRKFPISVEQLKEILSEAGIEVSLEQFKKIQNKIKEAVIPDFIENPVPSGLSALRRYPEFREKKEDGKDEN